MVKRQQLCIWKRLPVDLHRRSRNWCKQTKILYTWRCRRVQFIGANQNKWGGFSGLRSFECCRFRGARAVKFDAKSYHLTVVRKGSENSLRRFKVLVVRVLVLCILNVGKLDLLVLFLMK